LLNLSLNRSERKPEKAALLEPDRCLASLAGIVFSLDLPVWMIDLIAWILLPGGLVPRGPVD